MKKSLPPHLREAPRTADRAAAPGDLPRADATSDRSGDFDIATLGAPAVGGTWLTLVADAVDTPRSTETPGEQAFRGYLQAADKLGSHLTNVCEDALLRVLSPARRTNSNTGAADSGAASTELWRRTVIPIESAKPRGNRRTMSAPAPNEPASPLADALDTSIIVRLHFAEAMMVLLFNTLDEKQQESVVQGFGKLLTKVDVLEDSGIPRATLQAYREALGQMQKMLESNPQPEELAVALGGDFAKRSRR
jgi:hypothetical protein